MKELIKKLVLGLLDILLLPVNFVFLGIWKWIRHYGMQYFSFHRGLVRRMGMLPIPDHYYQPQFVYKEGFDPEKERELGIDWKLELQLERLKNFGCKDELKILSEKNEAGYHYGNGAFDEGDADLYFLMIRNYKPKRIIEIGSGHSTRVASLAIQQNKSEGNETNMMCIEPYENPWLEKMGGVEIFRKSVEEIELSFFDQLEAGDFLFIDSSHVIRPENDVLFIYQHILPRLKKGVIIHVHDIFSPRHYPREWTSNEFRMWDEQYLVEILLSTRKYDILFSLNHLVKSNRNALIGLFPSLNLSSNPSSLWISTSTN